MNHQMTHYDSFSGMKLEVGECKMFVSTLMLATVICAGLTYGLVAVSNDACLLVIVYES
jgi:hypothetical protein